MPSLLILLLDVTSKTLIRSISEGGSYSLPELYQEEIPSIDLSLVRRVSWAESPFYEVINPSGMSLTISVGPAGTAHASQNSWTIAGNKFTGELDLRTSGINTMVSSGDAATQLEIKLPNLRAMFPVTIRRSVNLSGSTVPQPAASYITKQESDGRYLRRDVVDTFIMRSQPSGLKRFLVYISDDGSFRREEIT
ncbi:MAG TPA: hypothetical protein VNO50_10990 [Pyrinomonadaceae bacterium]|nr:hypothetical protein [Pyrinomonadaceae bacterium]